MREREREGEEKNKIYQENCLKKVHRERTNIFWWNGMNALPFGMTMCEGESGRERGKKSQEKRNENLRKN